MPVMPVLSIMAKLNAVVIFIVISLGIDQVHTSSHNASRSQFDTPTICFEEQHVNNVKISWNFALIDDKKFYYSKPLCVDSNGTYILRECINGTFITKQPDCKTLQMDDYACMDGLELMYEIRKGIKPVAFCYLRSANVMPFDEPFECPYKQVEAKDNIAYYFDLSNKFPVWMPFHRRDPVGGVGYFVSDGFRGTTYKPWMVAQDAKEIITNKCLSLDAASFQGDCIQKRYRVCVYRAIRLDYAKELEAGDLEADFCSTHSENANQCRISWQKNSLSCICPKNVSACEAPAVYPTGTSNCALGLTVDKNGRLIWMSSGHAVRNTFWAVDTNLQTKLKKYIVSGPLGWTTVDTVSCLMCEFKYSFEEIKIRLNSETMKISYEVQNQMRAFNAVDQYHLNEIYSIKCSMEAAQIAVEPRQISFSGLWQCEAVDLEDTSKKILSNVVQLDFGKYLFIVQFVADKQSVNIKIIYPLLDSIFGQYSPPNLLQWVVAYDKTETWVEVIYRFDVTLPDNDTFRNVYNLFNMELSAPEFDYLKVRVFNTLFCTNFTINQRGHKLIWPAAQVDEESHTNCYDKIGEPMKIKCVGSFTLGARFTPVPECYFFIGNTSEQLTILENSDAPPEEILTNLTTILQNNDNLTSEDFNKTANILEKWHEEANASDIIGVVSMIMTKDPIALHNSQIEVNVTDRVLYSLDVSLKTTLIYDTEEIIVRDNIECLFVDKHASIYSGAAYLTSGELFLLENNLSIGKILDLVDLESAVYINHFSTTGQISITMFKSSVLFNENETVLEYNAFHRVFGVLLPEDAEDIQIILIFPRDGITDCVYWLYGHHNYGYWKTDDNMYEVKDFTVCMYNHTTHYGQLIMQGNPLNPISDLVLSTMTALECGLSTIGLCVILITAAIFPTWRRKKKRLIHYCLVLLIQTVLLFVNTNVALESTLCILSGALLHFTVLSQFCWMVVIAVHQHQTLIVVYQNRPLFWESRWVLLFTYGLPLLILVIALSEDVHSYKNNENLGLNICYPSGDVLLYFLIVPTACVAFVNGCLFMWMLIKLTCLSKASSGPATTVVAGVFRTWIHRNLDKIRTLALMVFTLGITWWLGFAAVLFDSNLLLYLFSITTGMQGFLIFLANILAKKEVREMYSRKYKLWAVNRK